MERCSPKLSYKLSFKKHVSLERGTKVTCCKSMGPFKNDSPVMTIFDFLSLVSACRRFVVFTTFFLSLVMLPVVKVWEVALNPSSKIGKIK